MQPLTAQDGPRPHALMELYSCDRRPATRPARNASVIRPAAKIAHPATVTGARTTADPPGLKVALARGWYANQPKDAVPIGVKSPTTIMITPAARSTAAPTQPSFAMWLLLAILRPYRAGHPRPLASRSATATALKV